MGNVNRIFVSATKAGKDGSALYTFLPSSKNSDYEVVLVTEKFISRTGKVTPTLESMRVLRDSNLEVLKKGMPADSAQDAPLSDSARASDVIAFLEGIDSGVSAEKVTSDMYSIHTTRLALFEYCSAWLTLSEKLPVCTVVVTDKYVSDHAPKKTSGSGSAPAVADSGVVLW